MTAPRHIRSSGRSLPRPSAGRRRARRGARGLTLLEVVLASVLLGLVAVTIVSTLTLLARVQADDVQRLGAYELANRKILEYLDDKYSVGSESEPQELYGFRYRWHIDKASMQMKVKPSEASVRSAQALPPDRFERITVHVWLVDEVASRNGQLAIPGDELAVLTRIHDPVSSFVFRNPDSRNNNITNHLADLLALFNNRPMPAGLPSAGGTRPSTRPVTP